MHMTDSLTRRQVVIGGVVLFLGGCAESSRQAPDNGNGYTKASGPRIPPYDLGGTSSPSTGAWYEVQAGDSMEGISTRSGVAVDTILSANDLASARVTIGQRLWLPGASGIGAPAAPIAEPHPGETEPVPAEAPNGGYRLMPRAAWAVAAVRGNNVAMDGVSRITIHHTGEEPGLEGVPEVERLRRIEHYHQFGRHWSAIGYHYLVGRTGMVYEGRPVRYQGAHVRSNNEHNLGISVIGDFMRVMPAPAQLSALHAFLDDQRSRFHVGMHRVYGHRELGMSECPGDMLFSWLRRYRAAA